MASTQLVIRKSSQAARQLGNERVGSPADPSTLLKTSIFEHAHRLLNMSYYLIITNNYANQRTASNYTRR